MAYINFAVLVLSTILFTLTYIKSLQPAKLEQKIGSVAYTHCKIYRTLASIFEVIIFISYIMFYMYPISVLGEMPWNRWISIVLAILLGVPGAIIMFIGIKDSGKEGLSPKKEHTMFKGIYNHLRHPQTTGGVFLWFAIAIGSHSLCLIVYSFIWIPVYWVACFYEEQDLIRRYGII